MPKLELVKGTFPQWRVRLSELQRIVVEQKIPYWKELKKNDLVDLFIQNDIDPSI